MPAISPNDEIQKRLNRTDIQISIFGLLVLFGAMIFLPLEWFWFWFVPLVAFVLRMQHVRTKRQEELDKREQHLI